MAEKLIDDMSGKWDPAEYHDTFRDDNLGLVDRKVREGRTESVEPLEAETAAPRRQRRRIDREGARAGLRFE